MACTKTSPSAPGQLVADVRSEVNFAAAFPKNPLLDHHKLDDDLGLPSGSLPRHSLQDPFVNVAKQFRTDAFISQGQIDGLKTVGDAIQLVACEAEFLYEPEA